MEDIYPVDYSNSTLSDEEMIQREYDALIYDYEHSNHRKKVEVIQRAFTFARMAHEGVRRKSGEPYINHTLLSIDACMHRGIEVRYLIYNVYPEQDATIERETIAYLQGWLKEHLPSCLFMKMPIV